MSWHFTPYAVPLLAGVVILAGIAVMAWRQRVVPHAPAVGVVAALSWIYVLGYALELLSADFETAYFWIRLEYIGVTLVPLAVFYLIASYTEHPHFSRKFNYLFVLPVPLMTILFAWTNQAHELIWRDLRLEWDGSRYYLTFEPGAWYWVNAAYILVLVMIGIVLVVRAYPRTRGIYRQQLHIFLAGSSVPLVVLVVYLVSGIPALDLMAYSMAVSGAIYAYGVFRVQFMDVMPVARQAVFASMSDAVVVLDHRDRVVDINPAARRLFGLAVADVLGRTWVDVFAAWPAIAAVPVVEMGAPAETRQVTLEVRGRTRHMELRVSALGREGRQAGGCLIVLHDVTDRVQREQDRDRLIQSLEGFARMVAHDIKSPLSVMVSFSLLLHEEYDTLPEPEIREYLDVMADTGTRLTQIVDSLLLLATVDNVEPGTLRPVEMGPVVRHACDRLRYRIEASGAQVIVPAEWPSAVGHEAWIEEVWFNYLSNALKYGGSPPVITMGAESRPGGMARFWVHDNGPGLAASEQAQLFVPFTRLQPAQADGHGLGLSIVLRIIEKLHGQVGVESEPGAGSLFWFELPGGDPSATGWSQP